MQDSAIDAVSLILRMMGAFYVFAGLVAGRATAASAMLDAALAAMGGKRPSAREWHLTLWMAASSVLIFAGGACLMILAREAMWLFILCSLTQALYLTFVAPYYFDLEDPPDLAGRRQTTNAFFIYLIATGIVIWASGHRLAPWASMHPVLAWMAALAVMAFTTWIAWQLWSAARVPVLTQTSTSGDDETVG